MTETIASNVYTEAQHFALLTSAIERETASLAESKETLQTQVATLDSEKAALAVELADIKSRLDVLEAEKAAAQALADAAAKELADFKAELALQGEIAEKKTARVDRVKSANDSLSSDFFTEERAQRWAEMTDEAFEALVADLTEAAACKPKDDAAMGDGCKDDANPFAKKKDDKQKARETAAFAGGKTATSVNEGGSTLSQLLGARRRGVNA